MRLFRSIFVTAIALTGLTTGAAHRWWLATAVSDTLQAWLGDWKIAGHADLLISLLLKWECSSREEPDSGRSLRAQG